MKSNLKVYLAWCIAEDDSEHGYGVVAMNETQARSIIMYAYPQTKACTITEATETTKQWKSALHEMYEKQNKILGLWGE